MKRFCFRNIKMIFAITAIFSGINFLYAFGERNISEVTLSNGIPVYIAKNMDNQIDAVCIGVKGGTSFYTKETSGIENVVFNMMLNGSASYSKTDMQNFVYATSSRFRGASLRQGSVLSVVCIEDYLKEALPYLLDGFVNPQFEQKEYENLMNEYQAGIQSVLNDPESMALYYGKQILYNGHPYEVLSGITQESIYNITYEAVKNYHASLMNSNRIFVVAVTSMAQEELVPILENYLAKIPAGEALPEEETVPELNLKQSPLVLAHPSAQGTGFVIRAYNTAGIKSEDYIPYLIAKHIYSKVAFSLLRTKYGICYSFRLDDFSEVENVGYELLYRCSDYTDLKKRMGEARSIIKRGEYITGSNKDGSFTYGKISKDFEGFVNSIKNTMYSSLQTTGSTADTLCRSLLLWGDLNSLDEQRNRINSVTIAEVQSAFEKYINSADEDCFWVAAVGPENEELLESILNDK